MCLLRPKTLAVVAFVSFGVCSANAGADQEQIRREAALRIDRGTQHFKNGDFRGALSEFKAAYQATRSWRVLIHIGITQNRLFRYEAALQSLRRYIELGRDQISASERQQVEAELKRLREVLGELVIVVSAEGATIHIDDRLLGKSPLKKPVLLGPRDHKVRVTRPGYVPFERKVAMVSAARKTLEVALVAAPVPLRIFSRPTGATLSVAGREIGRTPHTANLTTGVHQIKASLSGFTPQTLGVALVPGKPRELHFELIAKAAAPPRPWYGRWYWWTAIGVAVAAGVTGAVIAAQPRYDQKIFATADDRTIERGPF